MGPKTRLVEELRAVGGPREGANVQRMRPPGTTGGPVAKTVVSGQAPPAAPHPAAVAHVAGVQAQRRTMADAQAAQRAQSATFDRMLRRMTDGGLGHRARDRAIELYLEHGISPDAAIAAVGGQRMSVDAARIIERALLDPRNPNDDAAYFRALDLHVAGAPVNVAIADAYAEEDARRARRVRRPQHVQEFSPLPAHIPPAPPRPRRYADLEGPAQRRQNATDNRAAGAGIAVLLAGMAALAWLLFGPDKPKPPPPPAQLPPPVKPPAPLPRQPRPQASPPVKQNAPPPRR